MKTAGDQGQRRPGAGRPAPGCRRAAGAGSEGRSAAAGASFSVSVIAALNATGRHPAPGGGPATSAGPGPGLGVGRQHGFDLVHRVVRPGLQGLGHHVGDAAPGQRAAQERLDGHLVGRAEPGRGGAPAPAGLVGQVDAAEDGAVGRLEGERPGAGPVERAEGRRRRGRASPGRSRWAGACRGPTAGRGSTRRAAPPWSARSTAGARRCRCGRSRCRRARAPRSPRGPCS